MPTLIIWGFFIVFTDDKTPTVYYSSACPQLLIGSHMKKWSGDGLYYLPARQIEPYRLWFEFLKLAATDPDIDVNHDFYAEWGDFRGQSFNDWWSDQIWMKLFAVDAGVRVLEESETVINDKTAIIVRLPLAKDPKETLKDVAELLEQHNADHRLSRVPQGKFALTEGYEKGFLKYLPQVRLMLRLYGIWLSHRDIDGKGRVGQTAIDFITWAWRRDNLIKSRGYKYERPLIPYAVAKFAEEVIAGGKLNLNTRRAFMRHLQKARSLAGNAASGSFPGEW